SGPSMRRGAIHLTLFYAGNYREINPNIGIRNPKQYRKWYEGAPRAMGSTPPAPANSLLARVPLPQPPGGAHDSHKCLSGRRLLHHSAPKLTLATLHSRQSDHPSPPRD